MRRWIGKMTSLSALMGRSPGSGSVFVATGAPCSRPLDRYCLISFWRTHPAAFFCMACLFAGVGWDCLADTATAESGFVRPAGTATSPLGQFQACGAHWFRHPLREMAVSLGEPFASSSTTSGVAQMLFVDFGVASNPDDQASEFATIPHPSQRLTLATPRLIFSSRAVNDD